MAKLKHKRRTRPHRPSDQLRSLIKQKRVASSSRDELKRWLGGESQMTPEPESQTA